MDKRKIEEICAQTIVSHKASFEDLKTRWHALMNRYENKLREESISSKTESKVALGGAFALVENALPRIFSRSPKYKYIGRESKDTDGTEAYEEFSQYQYEEANLKTHLKTIARYGLACGLAGWKIGWKEENTVIRKKGKEILGIRITNPMLVDTLNKYNLGKSVKIDETKTLANYTILPIAPHNLIWTTESTEMGDMRVFGHLEERSIADLKSQGYDVRNLIADVKNSDSFKQIVAQNDGISLYRANKLAQEEIVEVAELYTRIQDNGIYKFHIVTMAYHQQGQPMTIRFEETPLDDPFIPMGIFRPIDRLGKFYGFGLIEPATGTLDAEEDLFNMSLEALYTDISKPMEYNPNNIIDIDSLEYRPRTLVAVRQLGQSVLPMATPQLPTGSVQYGLNFLSTAKQNTTGITDFQTGAEQVAGGKTLGEVQIKTQESNQRLRFIIENFEEQVLLPIGRMALKLNRQYLSDKQNIIYRVIGKKGGLNENKIKFKDIDSIKDVSVVSGSTSMLSQQEEIAKWSALLNQAYVEAKEMQPVPVNREEMWIKLMENGYMIKDIENYLPSVKEREEGTVKGKNAQLDDALSENSRPITARVLPTDIHEVHIPIHQDEINARTREVEQSQDPQAIQELQMLVQHLNDHTMQAGGQVPQYSQGMEVGQGIDNQPNQQQI